MVYRLLTILLTLSFNLPAQQIKYVTEKSSLRFTIPDAAKKAGIKKVRVIFKDSHDLIWVGTDNGLYRYDGTNAVYLHHSPNNISSIPNNVIVSITEDKQGNIWIGTLGGVGRLNRYTLKCHNYLERDHQLVTDFDNKVFADRDGIIWTGNNKGLEFFNEKEGRFQPVWSNEKYNNKAVSSYITCIQQWGRDSLVAGTFSDLMVINKRNYGFRRIALPAGNATVMNMTVDYKGRLWVGTWGSCGYYFESLAQEPENFWWDKKIDGGNRILNSLLPVSNGTEKSILLGIANSVLQIKFDRDGTPLFNQTCYFENSSTENNSITHLTAISEGLVLAGTVNGLINFSSRQNRFVSLPIIVTGSIQEPKQIKLNGKTFLAIPTWHSRQGIFIYDEKSGAVNQLKNLPADQLEGSNISTLEVDSRGRIWASSFGGVTVLNKNWKTLYDFKKAKGIDTLTRKKTNGLLISNDTVWINCYKSGIDLYNLDYKKLTHLSVNNPGQESPVWKIFKDSKAQIWLCGNASFYQYLPDQKRFAAIDLSEEKTACMAIDVCEAKNGHLLVATEKGLVDFDPEGGRHHFIRSGLLEKEETVFSVTVDAEGDVWYITANHLVRYNPTGNRFTLFDEKDGIQSPNDLQWVKTFDGHTFYLAERNGIVSFHPGQWQKTSMPPKLMIHSLQVADSDMVIHDLPQPLHLRYDQNKIAVEVDGINYEKPELNSYAYKLAPAEKEWTVSPRNFVAYNNLSPGHYVLHLKVANHAGQWSDEYGMEITISPPYWKTWWFITIAAILVVAVFIFVIRYISQRNLREKILRLEKETAIEKERNRIAQDMHDDLGSGLTKIAILSEVAKTQLSNDGAAATPLEKISSSSRQLVDSLQDMIWVLNPHNDTADNLAIYIREYALKFFEGGPIQVQFHYPDSIPPARLSEEQRRNFFLVVKESLNNVAKHSGATGVDVTLTTATNIFTLEISDNGKGFEKTAVRTYATGLKNMESRMTQISGQYTINSKPGEGTTTKLVLPL